MKTHVTVALSILAGIAPCGPALHWANFANETFCDHGPQRALTAGGPSGAYTKTPATRKEKNHGCC
jgi:hypothetical protein